MSVKIFQSYLIIGDKKQTQAKTEALLVSLDIKVGTGPDIAITVPQKSIAIEEIREIKSTIDKKPFLEKYKVYIIREADKLTLEAQNALLKIFEEPPKHAIIILETANPKKLLETIRSRAVIINIIREEQKAAQYPAKNIKESLLQIPSQDDTTTWIDQQIEISYQSLREQIYKKQNFKSTAKMIENYKEAKTMLNANVNPRFVIANAILNTQAS